MDLHKRINMRGVEAALENLRAAYYSEGQEDARAEIDRLRAEIEDLRNQLATAHSVAMEANEETERLRGLLAEARDMVCAAAADTKYIRDLLARIDAAGCSTKSAPPKNILMKRAEWDSLSPEARSVVTLLADRNKCSDDWAAAMDERDRETARLDWLSRQYVVVRKPVRYGTRECFSGSPAEDAATWDLRGAIDAQARKP